MALILMILTGTVVNVDDRFRFELPPGWVESREGRYELRRNGKVEAVIRVLPKGVQAMPLDQCVRVYSEKMKGAGWSRTWRLETDGGIRAGFRRSKENTEELWTICDGAVYQFQFSWTEGAEVEAERNAFFAGIGRI